MPNQSERNSVRIKSCIVGRVPFRRFRVGLLVPGITSLLVFAGTALANAAAPLSANGDGMTITIVSAQLVNKVAVNVNVEVTCSRANAPGNPSNVYFVIAGFTLTENVKGAIVSYQGNVGDTGNWPYVVCDGTPQTFTVQVLPTGPSAYKAGPAFVSNGQAGAWDSESSCGYLPAFNFPASCDHLSF